MQNAFYSYTDTVRIDYLNTPGWKMKEFHFHDHWEIKICRSCHMTVAVDGDRAECHGPCIVVYRPFSLHWANSTYDGAFERYNINFTESFIENYLDESVSPEKMLTPGLICIPLEWNTLESIYRYCAMLDAEKEDEESRKLLVVLILREIRKALKKANLESGVRKTACPPYDPARNEYIYSVMNFINENSGDHDLIGSAAKAFFISSAKLRSDFKKLTGQTIGDYIDCVRLIRAKRLLVAGESIASVAEKCGYSHRNSFIRFFQKQTGVSPAKYSSSIVTEIK